MSITRVQYRERQRLTAADLRAEQDYRLGLGGRHHLTHHDWGVVAGLRVIANSQGGFTLTRGVAIDGYGREILVPEPVELESLDLKKCWSILLYYCEYPEQLPPGRPCHDDPAPRVAQRLTRADVAEDFTPAALALDDFSRARAAGGLAGLRPWPVAIARIGLGCHDVYDEDAPLVDYSVTRYVRHRASVVRSPTGRALMQLGLARRTDVYHFLLSTRDNGKGLSRRVGIDRDGVTHVWRPLVIYGAQAVGQVAVAANKILQIVAVMPAGIRRVRVAGLIDAEKHTLKASLVDLGNLGAIGRPALEGISPFNAVRPLSIELPLGQARAASFNLVDTSAKPVAFARVIPRAKQEQEDVLAPQAAAAFSVELTPSGGKLVMKPLERSSEVILAECGDVRNRAEAGEGGTPVVQFRPASDIPADPLAREIHAVTTSKPTDSVPRTELRLSGGAGDDSDTSSRVSVGAWVDIGGNKTWVPSLRMDGGRRLEILAAPGAATSEPLLEVDDSVYLPPIGKKDPLLPDMLAMAFMAGLRLIGRVSTATTAVVALVPAPQAGPATITRGQTVEYSLTITYPNAVLKRCVEIVRGIAGTGDMAFRSIPIDQLPATTVAKTFTTPNFTHSASKVVLEILLLVAEGNVSKVVVSNSLELVVG
jgi:hypothetical protein